MENEVHFGACTVFVHDGLLTIAQNGGFEFHCARFVSTVNIAECGGEEEAADRLQCFVNGDHVFGGGVKFFSGDARGVVAVFFATDHASFDFEDDVEFGAFLEKLLREIEVFGER